MNERRARERELEEERNSAIRGRDSLERRVQELEALSHHIVAERDAWRKSSSITYEEVERLADWLDEFVSEVESLDDRDRFVDARAALEAARDV
jgi:hypothetical protein